MNNTKESGQFSFLIYKKPRDKYFIGICLELDIVEQNEDPAKLRKSLEEAAQGYLAAVAMNNLDNKLLNKTISKKYQKIVEEMENSLHQLHQSTPAKKSLPLQDGQFFTRNVNDLALCR